MAQNVLMQIEFPNARATSGRNPSAARMWPGPRTAVWGLQIILALFPLAAACAQRERSREPAAASVPLNYVAIGASDTVGTGAKDPVMDSWVAVVSRRLPAGSRFLRLGLSGATAAQAQKQLLASAAQTEADLVTIWLATNDFDAQVPLDEYQASLAAVIKGAAASPRTRVFVGNIPDLSKVPSYRLIPPAVLKARIDIWNGAIANVCRQTGATLVDLYEASRDRDSVKLGLIAQDGFHPSTAGYKVIADLFWQAIRADRRIGPLVSGK